MSFQQKSTIATLAALVGCCGIYFAVVGAQLVGSTVDDVEYRPLLVVMTVVLALVMAMSHGALAILAPDQSAEDDERDREIARRGSQLGGIILATGVFCAIVLALTEAHYFYIANVLLLGWVLAEVAGGMLSLYLYRRGVR